MCVWVPTDWELRYGCTLVMMMPSFLLRVGSNSSINHLVAPFRSRHADTWACSFLNLAKQALLVKHVVFLQVLRQFECQWALVKHDDTASMSASHWTARSGPRRWYVHIMILLVVVIVFSRSHRGQLLKELFGAVVTSNILLSGLTVAELRWG